MPETLVGFDDPSSKLNNLKLKLGQNLVALAASHLPCAAVARDHRTSFAPAEGCHRDIAGSDYRESLGFKLLRSWINECSVALFRKIRLQRKILIIVSIHARHVCTESKKVRVMPDHSQLKS
jgi:hypothetical protein